MKSYTKLTPEGVRDVLFEECRALSLIHISEPTRL